MGRAYLIPFNDFKKNITVCTLIIGYKGLISLAYRSGQVKTLMAQIVCENDAFDFEFGLQHRLSHKPALKDRGEVIAVYSYGLMEGGMSAFDVMSVEDVERIQKRSKSAGSGPWVTDWEEMARKTVLKRLSKYLPLSVDFMDAVSRETEDEAEDETRFKAARVVVPKAAALPEGNDMTPMPDIPQYEREAVPMREEVASTQTVTVRFDGALTPEEKADIQRQEAFDAATEIAAKGDTAGAIGMLMDLDTITVKELEKMLRAKNIPCPRGFEGPGSLTDKVSADVLKSWPALRLDILAARQPDQSAP